jgi:hypothetical protein
MTFGLFLKKFSMVSPLHPHEYSLNSLTPTQNREIGDPISMGVSNGFKIQPLTGHLLEFTSKFIGKAEGCQSALLTGGKAIPTPSTFQAVRNFGVSGPVACRSASPMVILVKYLERSKDMTAVFHSPRVACSEKRIEKGRRK